MTWSRKSRGRSYPVDSEIAGPLAPSADRAKSPVPVPAVIAMMLRLSGDTGVQTHVVELERYIRSREDVVSVVTPFSCGGVVRDAVFGVRRLLKPWKAADVAWYRHWHGYFLQRALTHQLETLGEAVVYCQCPVAAKAALRARRNADQRVVMAVHFRVSQADEWVGKGFITRDGKVFRDIRQLEREVLAGLDGIVFVSASAQADLWVDDLAGVPTVTIPNFVATTPSVPASGQRADLITVGTLEARKNHGFLLDTLAAAKSRGHRYTLDIAGDGPDRRLLLRQLRALGIEDQVRLLGYVPEAGKLLSGYRAYVHPAKSEVLPLSIIEAMAAGIPVIAAPVGGIPELFDQAIEGFFWSIDDPEEAASVLIGLMSDEAVRARMGTAARQRFLHRYDAAVVGTSLYTFLTSALCSPVRSDFSSECPVETGIDRPRLPDHPAVTRPFAASARGGGLSDHR